jgi:acyl dehydratase
VKFAELRPGMVLASAPRRVSEAEIIEFARQYDPQWFHLDPQRARSSRWQGLIASGWLTCSIAMRLAVDAVLAGSDSIGSPGVDELKWLAPVRPDDELQLQIEVLESRPSRSGTVGVVRWRWRLTNQSDTVVLEMTATSLFELA